MTDQLLPLAPSSIRHKLIDNVSSAYFLKSIAYCPCMNYVCVENKQSLFCRDLEDTLLDEATENLDRNSLASFGSGNTTDSDKVSA